MGASNRLRSVLSCLVACMALGGCEISATDNPLPDRLRIPMPDLRGFWVAEIEDEPGSPETKSQQVVFLVSGPERDERGCFTIRYALFDARGESPYGPDSRDVYESDVTWCAYQIADLTVIEEQLLDPDRPWYQHSILAQVETGIRFCVINSELASYASPEDIRKDDDGDTFITLASEELAALLQTRAQDLHAKLDKDCPSALRRLVPVPAD